MSPPLSRRAGAVNAFMKTVGLAVYTIGNNKNEQCLPPITNHVSDDKKSRKKIILMKVRLRWRCPGRRYDEFISGLRSSNIIMLLLTICNKIDLIRN